MNISSYNVTDIAYHYIGMRVIAALPAPVERIEQTTAIGRNVRKYVHDNSLRLMLPEPRGTFETTGIKVCQELVHLGLASSASVGYSLTLEGQTTLELLYAKEYRQLRRKMIALHLRTYDNLRAIVQAHLDREAILRPVVDPERENDVSYICDLLKPIFREQAETEAQEALSVTQRESKRLEDVLRHRVLGVLLPSTRMSEPNFRGIGDRLASMRLLNLTRTTKNTCEYDKTYTPCVADSPPYTWYSRLDAPLPSGEIFTLYLSEPDMADGANRDRLLAEILRAFKNIRPQAGYFDLPTVRDYVCNALRIPEAAFDEGVNLLLDENPAPLSVGLQYEGISARRKPLTRTRESTKIYNLIRRG